jgi:hypothetical protein
LRVNASNWATRGSLTQARFRRAKARPRLASHFFEKDSPIITIAVRTNIPAKIRRNAVSKDMKTCYITLRL